MKKLLSMTFVLVFSMSINNSANAQLPNAGQIIDMFKMLKGKICEKADLFSGKFTIRSFGGALCLNPTIAKIALFLCRKTPDFAASGCAANARTAAVNATRAQTDALINKADLKEVVPPSEIKFE